MKFIAVILAVIIGHMAYYAGEDAYANYRHKYAIVQCKREANAPKWADGITNWACEQWAK